MGTRSYIYSNCLFHPGYPRLEGLSHGSEGSSGTETIDTETDSSVGCHEASLEDLPGHLDANGIAEELFVRYVRAKKRFRHFMGKPTRKERKRLRHSWIHQRQRWSQSDQRRPHFPSWSQFLTSHTKRGAGNTPSSSGCKSSLASNLHRSWFTNGGKDHQMCGIS